MADKKITCTCGAVVSLSNLGRHQRTAKHIGDLAEQGYSVETPEPVNEWAIPQPSYDALTDVYEEVRNRRAYGAVLAADLKKQEAHLRWRLDPKHGQEHLAPKYQAKVDDLNELIRLNDFALAGLEEKKEAASEDRRSVMRDFWQRVDEKVVPQVAGKSENSDLVIRSRGEGTFEVELATGKILTANDGSDYPETRFGYHATVYGPDSSFRTPNEYRAAYVSWGSLSGRRTSSENRLMLKVYAAAIELCDILNDLLGLEEAQPED